MNTDLMNKVEQLKCMFTVEGAPVIKSNRFTQQEYDQLEKDSLAHPSHFLHLKKTRKTYTDEEIELFVEGFIDAHVDTQAWKEIVRKLGKEEARQQLRDGFKNTDTRKNRKLPSVH